MMGYSSVHFALFRFALGTYLGAHFVALLPYGGELFSGSGMFPEAALAPWPIDATPARIEILLGTAAVVAVLLAAGVQRRAAAAFLAWVWGLLQVINPLIPNVSSGYVGWLLLLCVCAPTGEGRTGRDAAPGWDLPAPLFWAAWVILALAYAASGVHKLGSPSWLDGNALRLSLSLPPIARSSVAPHVLAALPERLVAVANWAVLTWEIAFPALCVFRRGRAFAWGSALLLHLAILACFDLTELTLGVGLFHLLTLDPQWYARDVVGARRRGV
jgi:hypothetical protein